VGNLLWGQKFRYKCVFECIKHKVYIYIYIQTGVLEELALLNPNARWWIKGDGMDEVKGLWESVTGE